MKDLESKNLLIRKFKIEDAMDVHKNLATEKKLTECLGYTVHKNLEETKRMVESYIQEYEMGELIWAIEEKSTNEVIGYINAIERSDLNKVCKLKFGIATNKVDTGLMEEALKVVLEYLQTKKGFNVIVCEFFDGCDFIKKAKTKFLENVGMKKEAVLHKRNINEKTGQYENKIIYSIIK